MNEIIAQKILADFLKQPIDAISCTLLTGGSEEGSIIQCTHNTKNYVVKFFSSGEFGKHEIAWTQHAADLGIGPAVYYADQAGWYMLMDFCQGNSLTPSTANTSAIIKNVAIKLALLHHSSAPFAHVSNESTRIEAKYKKLTCAGVLKEMVERGMQHVHKAQLQKISPVPCHNDLNWGNIFVHNQQVAFIDWGDAALGNPYYDIAAFFVLNAIEVEHEKIFFDTYDEKLLAPQGQLYMQLCKQLVHVEFALNLLSGVQAGKRELLYAPRVPEVKSLDYYLTLLAQREVKIDSDFLYETAIASLSKINIL